MGRGDKEREAYLGRQIGRVQRTPSKSRRSSRWRGIMVTCSISQRKETSEGRRPGGSGKAIAMVVLRVLLYSVVRAG